MDKKLLLTGASGVLGRVLTARLAAKGYRLLLSDKVAFPDPLPEGAEFRQIDLVDKQAVLALAPEVSGIAHFGAVPVERPFEEIIGPNIAGCYHIFEVARLAGARVLFASSNHAIGFHERSELLDEDCDLRPDGYYGLSKAYGELMARLYWDKHGVESLSLRIGSALPRPAEKRHLATWLSNGDLAAMVEAAFTVPHLGCRVAWGASANRDRWWRSHDASLGCTPTDDAAAYEDQLGPEPPYNPVVERYQGGAYTAIDYSREAPSPADIFDWLHEKK
jgi:uronate dehydrogenase